MDSIGSSACIMGTHAFASVATDTGDTVAYAKPQASYLINNLGKGVGREGGGGWIWHEKKASQAPLYWGYLEKTGKQSRANTLG